MTTIPDTVSLLVVQANRAAEQVSNNPFFSALRKWELDDLNWIWNLLYHSDHFCRALSLRSGFCEDNSFKEVFADHAHAEVKHPAQLRRWMESEGFDMTLLDRSSSWADGATDETKRCAEFYKQVALFSSPATQIFILNVFSERLALLFYQDAGKVLKRLGKQHGPYWHVHEEVDEIHATMGLDLLDISEAQAQDISFAIDRCFNLYNDMIVSWM